MGNGRGSPLWPIRYPSIIPAFTATRQGRLKGVVAPSPGRRNAPGLTTLLRSAGGNRSGLLPAYQRHNSHQDPVLLAAVGRRRSHMWDAVTLYRLPRGVLELSRSDQERVYGAAYSGQPGFISPGDRPRHGSIKKSHMWDSRKSKIRAWLNGWQNDSVLFFEGSGATSRISSSPGRWGSATRPCIGWNWGSRT
jgi:hypothetical protein